MDELVAMTKLIVEGEDTLLEESVNRALSAGIDPLAILHGGLQPGMTIVGDRFARDEIFVPDVLLAARAMQRGVEALQPSLAHVDVPHLGTVVIGTVVGDVHDIGKNLVAMMLQGVGFRVVDLGTNVHTERFIHSVEQESGRHPRDVGTVTSTLPAAAEDGVALGAEGLRGRVATSSAADR